MNFKDFKELFQCRTDVYAECWYSKKTKRYAYKSIKKPLTDKIIKEHIFNKKNYGIGVYPLLEGNVTKWISSFIKFRCSKC